MSGVVALPLSIGARTLWRVNRRLVRCPLGLAEALAGEVPVLPPLPGDWHGYLVTSLPESSRDSLTSSHPKLRSFVRQRYRRSYIDLGSGFDAWLGGFSGKSRSTLKRKLRRFAERSGGSIDLRRYRTPDEMAEFHRLAGELSAKTYQQRLLGAGLPQGPEALAAMKELAARDSIRGWILFLDGEPASYLHAPAEGDTLVYAHLGYDPRHSGLSPGTVLQFEAIRELMEERRFRLFDFTEGEGPHKTRFATGSVECVDLLLLRPTLGNLAAAGTLGVFDGAVALAKTASARLGLESLARSLLR